MFYLTRISPSNIYHLCANLQKAVVSHDSL